MALFGALHTATHVLIATSAFLLLLGTVGRAGAFDPSELEIFDLVEELGTTTFYELLGVQQDASSAEIRRAYRKQSLVFHPDKNHEEGAELKFRQIAAVAEILRDEEKRAIYNRVLVEGLPNWQQPVYYYRQVRRMGTAELLLAVGIISTVVHYGFLCAVFLEQYYQAEVETAKRSRRKGKKAKSGGQPADAGDESEEVRRTPFPGPLSLLPIVLVKKLVLFVLNAPSRLQQWKAERQQQREEAEQARREEDERQRLAKEEAERAAEMRQRRVQYKLKQKQDLVQDLGDDDNVDWGRVPNAAEASTSEANDTAENESTPASARKPWTEEEITALTRAFVRFPGGTLKRWEKIADEVGRSVGDVTAQVKQLKHRVAKAAVPPAAGLEASKRAAQSSERLTKDITVRTNGDAGGAAASTSATAAAATQHWSQEQQKLLEQALLKHGRDAADRWERVAADVPGKSKGECMARYKQIALQVRQRKSTAAPVQASS
ncbi:dnaJ homolog subfamily C member 1-like [Sycon ciliatum]|uniref:dnaJ homolog subfamily C member 1-like n=1 Tax=Sycon ciliatum TaxID=27933 RepID=UPI0031F64BF0|eukprot:scpid54675/ scgid13161/ DnaJ homolog subfamily C member 1; DnaJ protein homolog MTJ1